ncbi:DUF4229 domain-containing protein [Gordonia jinhuaensis]|uniref:DUF4229 domain-containing protein n=1 Tax=Gordonia jinhuaensis TaxID=1517702 RepID=A0A916SZL2_9ACTN|nr:DUF4229 domain-containing protein [Gordonia jinhuaensis]GGB21669.1 hypothetical protein GCM10011489_07310 [Gordonia jinhuaensis]
MNETNEPRPGAGRRLAVNLLVYTVIRLGLVVVVAALIMGIGALAGVTVPLLVAAVFGVLIALPLGMLAFRRQRNAVNESIAEVDTARRNRRADLEARMRGAGRSPNGSGRR